MQSPVYDDGLISIYHGDAREILSAINADVMVTDPPYGIQHTGHGYNGARTGVSIENDSDTEARDAILEMWGDRPALCFGSSLMPLPDGTRQVLCWDKGNAAGVIGAHRGWRYSWEPIYVLGDWPRVPATDRGVIAHDADRQGAKDYGHPHTKPVPLMRDLIRKCPDGVIVDPFMGSGSTLRAAKDLGVPCIGIEIDELHIKTATKRLGQEVLF